VAIRPGFVDTPTTLFEATLRPEVLPLGPQTDRQLASREHVMTPEEAGRGIWEMLQPTQDTSVLWQGEMVVVESKMISSLGW
jgi:benzil reductase ((S)-benzoin forming)